MESIDKQLPKSRPRRSLREGWIKNVAESQRTDAADKDSLQDREMFTRRRTRDRLLLPSVLEAEIKLMKADEAESWRQRLQERIMSENKEPENESTDRGSLSFLIAVLRNLKIIASCFRRRKNIHERGVRSSSVVPLDDRRSSAVVINFSDTN